MHTNIHLINIRQDTKVRKLPHFHIYLNHIKKIFLEDKLSYFNLVNVAENSLDKKYSIKPSDHEKAALQRCHVQTKIDGNRKTLLLDHQPCQLSDLSCTDTYHIGDKDYQNEEILFDFEEEFYGYRHNPREIDKEVYLLY